MDHQNVEYRTVSVEDSKARLDFPLWVCSQRVDIGSLFVSQLFIHGSHKALLFQYLNEAFGRAAKIARPEV